MSIEQEKAIHHIKNGDTISVVGPGGCVDADTEFFSDKGWKRIADYEEGDLVAQVCGRTRRVTLCKPQDYIKLPCDFFYTLEEKGKKTSYITQMLSEEHDVAYEENDECELKKMNIKEFIASGYYREKKIPSYYYYGNNNYKEPLRTKIDSWGFVKSKDGFKYCFTVPTGFLFLRRDGIAFITGNSGKSHTIKQVSSRNTVIATPTAVSAINVGGETAHSLFGLSWGAQTQKDLDRITPNMRAIFDENSPIDFLVIDEAYNMVGHLLDAIDYKLRKIRKNDLPFGGLQVIFSGDPAQCSPWWDKDEKVLFRKEYLSPFVFHSKVWRKVNPEVVLFEKIYRNSNPEQQAALNAIRIKDDSIVNGKPAWQNAVDFINDIAVHGETSGNDLHMCTYHVDVAKRNSLYYDAIKGVEKVYNATIVGKFKKDSLTTPATLKLKVGARVVFTVNNREQQYYNGTQGTVMEMHDEFILVMKDDGDMACVERNEWVNERVSLLMGSITKIPKGKFTQFPLRLGWASTINSAQGLTLQKAAINFGREAFAAGQGYVALSRLQDLNNLTLTRPLMYNDIKVDNKAIKFLNKHRK